jgi:ubiquinone/menaquinone biosynthesis C-methylase UbiE
MSLIAAQNDGALRCSACDRRYPVENDIPCLIDPEHRAFFDAFNGAYDTLRLREGWASVIPGYYTALPWRDVTGRHVAEWRLRARSTRRLLRWIRDHASGQPMTILDAGAGSGWLSRILSEQHEVAAVDINPGPHGLNAISPEERTWLATQASLAALPFVDACFDGIVASASLHCGQEPKIFLNELSRILKQNGRLVVMDSPVYPDENAVLQARERSLAYFSAVGSPSMADHYTGLTGTFFRDNAVFHFHCLSRDFYLPHYLMKRVRTFFGGPVGARFPMWIGKRVQ